MRTENTTLFMGDQTLRSRKESLSNQKEGHKSKSTISGADFNGLQDPILQKRKEAQAKAMKVIGDVWQDNQKVDQELKDRYSHIKELRSEMGIAGDEINRIEQEREVLRDSYGVDPDSEEEADLKFLIDQKKSGKDGPRIQLTDEENEKLARIEEKGLTEYQQRSLDLYESQETYKSKIEEAKEQIREEVRFISSSKKAIEQDDSMKNAQEAADKIEKAASEEIIGMLRKEAKDHIDEKLEEEVKAAEEKAEKEEEEEKKKDEKTVKKKEEEQTIEDIHDNIKDNMNQIKNEGAVELSQSPEITDVQKEIKELLNKLKLTDEDLKGAAVDTLM